LAIIALVQGAGCSKSYANPDGAYPDTSRDFIGQGVANMGAGLLQGMPIGGSVSGTALNISSGARSRWANVFSGLVVVLAVLLFSSAVSLVAMPAMAALLIVAGAQSIKVDRIRDVWDTGMEARLVMLVTFALTLAIPLQRAVFLGVLLTILMHFFVTSARETRLTQLQPIADGLVNEVPAPTQLVGNAVTILQIYGNMTFAGAETLEAQLPTVGTAQRPVVILRLRDQEAIGSSFVAVLERYSQQLRAAGGKLMLAGVSARTKGQLDRTETTADVLGAENVFLASQTLGLSTRSAREAAESWLAAASTSHGEESPTPGTATAPSAAPPSASPLP
ncbi:MAG: SulP family inorganic anion transporter, partial [Caldilineaceae bacterium]